MKIKFTDEGEVTRPVLKYEASEVATGKIADMRS